MAEKIEHQKNEITGKDEVFLSSEDVNFNGTGLPIRLTPVFENSRQLQAWWNINEPRVRSLIEMKDWAGMVDIVSQPESSLAVTAPVPPQFPRPAGATPGGVGLSREEVQKMMEGTLCSRRCFSWSEFNRVVYNTTRRWIAEPPPDTTVGEYFQGRLAEYIALPSREAYILELGRSTSLDQIVDIIRRVETELVVQVAGCGTEQCDKKIEDMKIAPVAPKAPPVTETAEYKSLQENAERLRRALETYKEALSLLSNTVRHAEDIMSGAEHKEGP